MALETEVTSSGRQFRVFGDDGLGKLEGLSFNGVVGFLWRGLASLMEILLFLRFGTFWGLSFVATLIFR